MKKYLLKGREFLIKKFDLNVQEEDEDFVSKQIDKRLRDRLRIIETGQFDLESSNHLACYFRSYPNHPVGPLLQEKMTNKKEVTYQLAEQLKKNEKAIPNFDEKLEARALQWKSVVDEYDEGVPQLQVEPLVCIYVINFHHKRGTEIEYRYPDSLEIRSLEDRVVHNAMPDSSHNKSEDYNFFNFQANYAGRRRMIFGVSSFKQIKVTESMRQKNDEITRSHLQKAVCVLSLIPTFNYLKRRLMPTTKLFFQNFEDFTSVKMSFQDISKHLSDTWRRLQISELTSGTDLRKIIELFGHKFFEIYKALICQKRIAVFSHSSSSCSTFILSLLSLIPGMLTFGMHSGPIDRYLQGLREYGLPFKLFTSQSPLILSFHIQDFHILDKFKKPGAKGNFLIGTTNRLIKESKNLGVQVLVNLQEVSVVCMDESEDPYYSMTKHQKIFMDSIIQIITTTDPNLSYEGSQDWIRDRFHQYLKEELANFVDCKNLYLKFVQECRAYTAHRKKSAGSKASSSYDFIEDEDEQTQVKEKQIPIVDERVLQFPLVGLLGQPHFMYFLQFHNPNLHLLTQQYPTAEAVVIDNYEYYLGSIPMKISGNYISYNVQTRKLRFGNNFKGSVKQLKFDDSDRICEVYVGKVADGKYQGQGIFISRSQMYSGEFHDNSRHGFGKLIKPNETYIGSFENGLYHGDGQLVMEDGTIYAGHFRQGLREGEGRLQKQGLVYQGEFNDNEMSGRGCLTIEQSGIRYQGNFDKGKLIQGQQAVVKYPNGDAYIGQTVDGKPHGKGILRLTDGQTLQGHFKDGSFQNI